MNDLALFLILAAAGLIVAAVVRVHRTPPTRPVPRVRPAVSQPAPIRRSHRDEPHALYHYDRPDGSLIYYGISHEPPVRHDRRMNEFAKGDPRVAWVAESTGVMHIDRWYEDYAAANAAERIAVRAAAEAGHDLANDHYNPNRRARRAA